MIKKKRKHFFVLIITIFIMGFICFICEKDNLSLAYDNIDITFNFQDRILSSTYPFPPATGISYEVYTQEGFNLYDSGETGENSQAVISVEYDIGYYFYFFKEGCYYPGSTSLTRTTPLTASIFMDYYREGASYLCASEINSINNQGNKINNEIEITTTIQSAFTKGTGAASFVPPDYKDTEHYQSEVNVSFYVNNQIRDSTVLNIPIDETEDVTFTFIPTTLGYHEIKITAETTDCQCSSQETQTKTLDLTVVVDPSCSADSQCVIGCINGDQDCGCQQENAYLCNSGELCPGKILAHNQSQTATCCSQPCVPQGSLECIEGSTRTCGTDAGICQKGIETCQSGMWRNCTAITSEPKDCNSILDNDCNGEIDEQEAYCKLLKQNQTTVIITQNNNNTPIIQGPDPFCGDRTCDSFN